MLTLYRSDACCLRPDADFISLVIFLLPGTRALAIRMSKRAPDAS